MRYQLYYNMLIIFYYFNYIFNYIISMQGVLRKVIGDGRQK